MTTANPSDITKTAAYLRARTRTGIWNDSDARDHGIPIDFDGDTPARRVSLQDAEKRIAELPGEDRAKIEARLGLGTYRSWTSADRQTLVNRLLDPRPEHTSDLRWTPAPASRSKTDQLAMMAASALLEATAVQPVDGPRYTRDLYSRAVVLPAGNVGRQTEVHRRVIRSNVDGLDHIVIHQFEHLNVTDQPETHGMGGSTVRTINIRPDNHNGIRGVRNDLEIRFAVLNPSDAPREIGWIRTRELREGWLPHDRQFVWSYVPDMPTREATIQITFAPDALPSTAFRFEDVYDGDRLAAHIPVEVAPIRNGAAQWTWSNPPVGRACGIRVHW